MRNVIDAIRRHDVIDGALLAAARAVRRITRGRALIAKYYFTAQRVPETTAAVPAKGIVVDELREGDPRLSLLGRSPEEVARRFAAGATCLCAWHGEALAGFLWFTERPYEEDEVRCTFRVDPRDRAAWDFDVHVAPRFRLGRTFAVLWQAAFAAMRARGIRWTISRVSAFNPESIRAHQRLGALQTGSAVFVLWGSLQLTLSGSGNLTCRRVRGRPFPLLHIRAPADSPAPGVAGERAAAEAGAARRHGNAMR